MRVIPSSVGPDHADYATLALIRDAILAKAHGPDRLLQRFPELVREAIDFVIDAVRTGRTRFHDLDNVEKTFVGLKIEHALRDFLDVPKGIRDLDIAGMHVDIKNTTGNTWMIPPETFSREEPCIVVASEDATHRCWLGILMARRSYLTAPNRDGKRGVSSAGFRHILWLVQGEQYPRSPWAELDMERFRELRRMKGGTKRAAAFFRENQKKPTHRSVVQALLFDQRDYMKRLRGNGGARDVLRKEQIALLSGTYDRALIQELRLPSTRADEFIAVKPSDARQSAILRSRRLIP